MKIVPAGAEKLADTRSVDADIVLDKAPSEVVGRLYAEHADGLFKYRIKWTGNKSDIQEIGWAFEMPSAFDRFSWDRQALWSVYPEDHIGRPGPPCRHRNGAALERAQSQ